ncbi:MAG: hypothetical protein ACE5FF_03600 [Saprospiraceae bacterium]
MKPCCKESRESKPASLFEKGWNILVAAIIIAILAGVVVQLL